MKCEECKYNRFGHCVRYPPQLGEKRIVSYEAQFPEIKEDDWCGEYKKLTK